MSETLNIAINDKSRSYHVYRVPESLSISLLQIKLNPFFLCFGFLVAPLACCEARLNQSGCRVCVSVCGNFFPTNPYLQAGLTDLDEIWHDGRS